MPVRNGRRTTPLHLRSPVWTDFPSHRSVFFISNSRFNYLFTWVSSGNLRQKIPSRHSFSIDLHLRSKPESACLPGFRPHSFIKIANKLLHSKRNVRYFRRSGQIRSRPFPELSRSAIPVMDPALSPRRRHIAVHTAVKATIRSRAVHPARKPIPLKHRFAGNRT